MDRWLTTDDYITRTYAIDEGAPAAALEASDAAGLPSIAVSPPQGKLLHVLARAMGARRILEIGTLGGYSAIWLASALPPDGRLITLELDPRHAEVARSNLANAGVGGRTEVIVGPAIDSLRQMSEQGAEPFDLVFIDADKPGYPEYLEASIRLSRPGSLIVADNVVRQGDVADPANSDPRVRATRRFHELLAADDRLASTVIQTVGTKGHDGLALAVVLRGA